MSCVVDVLNFFRAWSWLIYKSFFTIYNRSNFFRCGNTINFFTCLTCNIVVTLCHTKSMTINTICVSCIRICVRFVSGISNIFNIFACAFCNDWLSFFKRCFTTFLSSLSKCLLIGWLFLLWERTNCGTGCCLIYARYRSKASCTTFFIMCSKSFCSF